MAIIKTRVYHATIAIRSSKVNHQKTGERCNYSVAIRLEAPTWIDAARADVRRTQDASSRFL